MQSCRDGDGGVNDFFDLLSLNVSDRLTVPVIPLFMLSWTDGVLADLTP